VHAIEAKRGDIKMSKPMLKGADHMMTEFAAELASSANEMAAALKGGSPHDRSAPRAVEPTPAVDARNFGLVMNIPVTIKVVLGSATMSVASLTNLQRGALVSLDRKVGDMVDITVNGRVIARGEVVVIDEKTSRFGVSLTEVGGLPGSEK
jgi:flagellar motor switch protein FliN/FliY